MNLNRRKLLSLSVVGAATLVASSKTVVGASSPEAIRDSALRYFTGLGYREIPPLDLITGAAFNGGLRYDETRADRASDKTITIQTAARVDDIAERDRPGVLAGFNMIGLYDPAPGNAGAMFNRVLDFLLNERNLDSDKMLFVSTEVFRPHAERLDAVRPDRILERPLAEARQAGDGSGYFAPSGHPDAPAYDTVAIYYPLPGQSAEPTAVHPPPGYIEIAEITLTATDAGAAMGLERLAMAEAEPVPGFKDSQQELLKELERESKSRGKPLPPGYAVFASL